MKESYKFNVDIDLLKKYNRPGPRYTSYPTAPHFHSGFGPQEYRQEIVDSNSGDDKRDLSLYFHFPFCRSLCYFCACNVIITHNLDRIADYLVDLKAEIDLISGLVSRDRKVVQFHWGGGTPTYLSTEQISDIYAYIHDRFTFADDAEIGVEVDPRRLTPEHLPTLRRVGFNRVSFGVQDFDDKVQQTVNRIQPEEVSRGVVEKSRELGFDSINVDLIYGLPYQSVESYARTLEKVIDIEPDRLAVFNYAHVPWLKKHQKINEKAVLPSTSERLNMLKMIIERLTEAGYVYIGMDHFAKPDDELAVALKNRTLYRNFQGYSTHSQADIYAMGVTSISQLQKAYAQNIKDPADYKASLQQGKIPTTVGIHLSDDDILRRHVITEIMCNSRVEKQAIKERFGVDFDAYFADSIGQLDEFIADGLVTLSPDRIEVSEAGRLVIRNIAMTFDRYLDADQDGEKPTYSRTV